MPKTRTFFWRAGWFAARLARGAAIVLVVAWAVATVTFILMRAIPGGPFSQERRLPTAVSAAVEKQYRLDEPLWKQYAAYLRGAAVGDFGPSYNNPGRRVGQIVAERLPASARLGLLALAMTLILAFPCGVLAALSRGGWFDRASGIMAALGVSMPSFILGSALLYWFCWRLHWFPATGAASLRASLLPALALAAAPAAYLTRLVRTEMLDIGGADFLRTARAKGTPAWRVVLVHALPHTLGPALAYLGPLAAAIMVGSFVVELIFDIPGLGRFYVTSISNRDYPMIMGVTLLYTVLLIAINLGVDGLARMIDPRQRPGAAR